jgi:hypothetical protein
VYLSERSRKSGVAEAVTAAPRRERKGWRCPFRCMCLPASTAPCTTTARRELCAASPVATVVTVAVVAAEAIPTSSLLRLPSCSYHHRHRRRRYCYHNPSVGTSLSSFLAALLPLPPLPWAPLSVPPPLPLPPYALHLPFQLPNTTLPASTILSPRLLSPSLLYPLPTTLSFT